MIDRFDLLEQAKDTVKDRGQQYGTVADNLPHGVDLVGHPWHQRHRATGGALHDRAKGGTIVV